MKMCIAVIAACVGILALNHADVARAGTKGSINVSVVDPQTQTPGKYTNAIPGVVISVKEQTGAMINTLTGVADPNGEFTFRGLPPGDYEIDIDGPSLAKAMDRLAPPTPVRHDSGPSVSLGIGGLFGGGGSHHSSGGAAPVGGSHGGSGGGSSTGGVGLGVNVPIGSNSDAGTRNGNLQISQMSVRVGVRVDGGGEFSISQDYCRENAGQGMRLTFKIAENESPGPRDAPQASITVVVVTPQGPLQ